MLAKDSDSCGESSVRISNFNNVDTNVSAGNLGEGEGSTPIPNSDSFTLGSLQPELSNINNPEELCDANEVEPREKWTLPDGYQFLPGHLFQFEGILPPLVSSSWLKSLNSDEDSGEDSIPLARLKKIIKKKKKLKKNSENSTASVNSNSLNTCKRKSKKRRKKQNTGNDYSPITRKRGRPKKQLTDTIESKDDFEHEEPTEAFWNDESDVSNQGLFFTSEVEIKIENQDSNSLVFNCNEHDYFKPVENADVNELGGSKTKKKRTALQGVKIGDSKMSFPCIECGKSFSAASTLKSHQRIHNGTLLICPECHKGFVSKYLLKCHMRIHNGDLLMCRKCGRGFTTAELLKVHSRAHTGDRPFTCNICGKSFPTSSNMLQHKQIHNSEKKFLCSQCGSSFVQKRCLDYHMLTHTEKKNICNVCGKLWARKSDLIEHMRVHTGVKPYCCSICPQKFSQASSLKRHQLVHMDVKPIQCMTCNKMFKCQEYYKRHLRKHKKEDYLFDDN